MTAVSTRQVVHRTEIEVVSEAVMALYESGIMGTGAAIMARAADIAGVTVADLRAAHHRNERTGFRPPRQRLAAAPVAPAAEAVEFPAPVPAQTRAATAVRVLRKNPIPGMRICARCGEVKPREAFAVKNRRTGELKSYCVECMRAYQRERYLAVRDYGLVAAARLILDAASPFIGDLCAACSAALAAGEEVEACDVALRHTTCPEVRP